MTAIKIITPDLDLKAQLFLGSDSTTAAKNIARVLSIAYPNHEFIIIQDDVLLHVEWTDGATCKEVYELIGDYNLLDYKGDSDVPTKKYDTYFNKSHGGGHLTLYRWRTYKAITGHICKDCNIMEGKRSPKLIKGTSSITALKNIVIELKERFPNIKFKFDCFRYIDRLHGNKIKDCIFVKIQRSLSQKDGNAWMSRIDGVVNKYRLYSRSNNSEFNNMYGGVDRVDVHIGCGGLEADNLLNLFGN